MADDVISALAVTVQLSTYLRVLCGNHERVHYRPWREGPEYV